MSVNYNKKAIFFKLRTFTFIVFILLSYGMIHVSAATISDGSTYLIVNRNSGLLMEVVNASLDDGANVQQWEENGHNCQKWRLEATDSGYYHITNVNSGKYLEVDAASTEGGANVQQYGPTYQSCQEWSLQSTGDGYYIIVNRNSGMAADVWEWSEEIGANIAQWSNTGGSNQQWMFVDSSDSSDSSSSSGNGNEVTLSGNTWIATVGGNTVYTGNRMFEAVNACITNMSSGTIDIRNSGDSGLSGGDIYAITPKSNMTLDFHGSTINCNSDDLLIVPIRAKGKTNITIKNLNVTGSPRYVTWFTGGCQNITLTNITANTTRGNGIRVADSGSRNLVIDGNIDLHTVGHCIETYTVNGVYIDTVTVRSDNGCGVLLNDSENCEINAIYASYCNLGGSYAGFRQANNNGTTHCGYLWARYCGRGLYSVSDSHNFTIDKVDIANCSTAGISVSGTSHDFRVNSGTVTSSIKNVDIWNGAYNVYINVNGSVYTQ